VVLKNFRKDGRNFWNELHVSPVRDAAGRVTHFIGVQSDITARKETEDSLRQRDAILEGISFAAETLLNTPTYEAALPVVLEQIGQATDCDHLCIWENGQGPEEAMRLTLKNIWCNPGLALTESSVLQPMTWDIAQGWPSEQQLRIGRMIQNGANCTQEEIRFLDTLNLASLLCLPIFTNQDSFWGLMTVGCSQKAFKWGFVEIEALRSAMRILGSVIHDRETDAALRLSEERFRSVVTNLKEVVFKTDAAGLWTFLNPAWTEITGFEVDETLGKLFLNYVHPDDRERNNRLFGPLIERKKEYCRHEVRYLTKNGSFCWIEVFARLVLDAKNQIVGTAGTLNDITMRKQAEETLQKQRAAIEAAIDGVAILDEAGRFTYLNSTHVDLFGYNNQNQLIGRNWLELYSPQDVLRFENEAFPQLKRCGKWRGSVTARRLGGSTFAEEISLTQVEGGGLVCVCRDITDRITAEQFILNSLQEKEVMLKEIHHRVKNNMQIVSSLLNLQMEHLKDEGARVMFAESQNRIASMALVHEKLYQSSDLARIDFTEYLRDLTDNLVGALGAKARNIVFELKSSDILLGIDTAIPCGLIINELVSNAYKHGFPDGGAGRVVLALERPTEGQLRLEISDTGRGIPAHVNLKQTKSLGMQLVHTLVQQLRGSIELQREGGTRFILHLQESRQKEHIRP
jgi:PAS domain S-box-containing protein